MREILPDTFDLVLDFNRAASLEQIYDLLIRRAAPFGVRHAMAAIIPKHIVRPEEQIGYVVFGSWPGAWIDRYFERQYVRRDPTLQHCVSRDEAVYWSELVHEHSDVRARQIMDEAKEFQLLDGITIPQATVDGHRIAVSFAGDRIDRSPRTLTTLTILSTYAVSRALQIRAAYDLDHVHLTQRETECLAWAAEGKTNADAADICGISVKAVEKHLAAARLKLGALTTAQAVAHAIKHGFIS